VTIARPRRIFADVPAALLGEVFEHLVRRMDFAILCAITGLDQGDDLAIMYHLARNDGVVLTLCAAVPKTLPIVPSVTPYFAAADVYEREMVDLLGLQVTGLPPGSRYPLPDDWPQGVFPLRKEFGPDAAKELHK
jgi:Ni,Fe-hydrogenase III component G